MSGGGGGRVLMGYGSFIIAIAVIFQNMLLPREKNPQTLENISYVAFANWKVWVLKT